MDNKDTAKAKVEFLGPVSDEQLATGLNEPSELDKAQLIAETYSKYDTRRQLRRPYEVQWYLNASALRGFPDVRWNADLNRLEVKREPAHRKRYRINHIKPKYIARVAKYTRIPPNPTVVPATTDREDIFNARASQKALEYFTRKGALRAKWVQSMQWIPITGKAFWSIRFNEDAISHAPTKLDGKLAPIMGEIEVEFCNAFEILPADPGIESMAKQPEIMRVRLVATKDLEKEYPTSGPIPAETDTNDMFIYQRQIADLGTRQQGLSSRTGSSEEDNKNTHTMLIERFVAPCAEYEKGRYIVCAGHRLLKNQDSLPGNFAYLTENPYPFVELCDDAAPGQFWPDAFIERMIGLQSEYNEIRSKMGENLAMHFFPKLVVFKQHSLDDNAYTSEAGERLNVNYIPGIPPPSFLQPSSVVGDAWNILNMIRKEMDDVTLIFPSSTGGAGGASSGFQTTLLQEAADQVHGPAILRNSLALEEAYFKIRHLQKQFYDIPRMIAITGKSNIPEVYEFSKNTIDEHSEIRIEPDSMMPQLRSARVDQIRQMFADGLFGDQADPKVQRRTQDMLRMAFSDFELERNQRDDEQAQMENIKMSSGDPLNKPQPWENHEVHWESHIDLFKSPEQESWTPEQKTANIFHALCHLVYLNPAEAQTMAREFGLEPAISELITALVPPPPPQSPPQNAPQMPMQAPPMEPANEAANIPMGMDPNMMGPPPSETPLVDQLVGPGLTPPM